MRILLVTRLRTSTEAHTSGDRLLTIHTVEWSTIAYPDGRRIQIMPRISKTGKLFFALQFLGHVHAQYGMLCTRANRNLTPKSL